MAGGTTAFDMIQSGRNNRNLRTHRKKMSENPYAQTSKNSGRNPSNYEELIRERDQRKSYHGKITAFTYLLFFITLAIVTFIGLLM